MDLPAREGMPALSDVHIVPVDPALNVDKTDLRGVVIGTADTAVRPRVRGRNRLLAIVVLPHLVNLSMELEHRIWICGAALSVSASRLGTCRVAYVEGCIAILHLVDRRAVLD